MSFTTEKKISPAHAFRAKGSTIIPEDAKHLKLVYFKYKSKISIPQNKLKFNLIFCHGTGFNKSVWTYYVNQLYRLDQTNNSNWAIDSVISIDQVGHGDSSLENEKFLGPIVRWDDGGKDVIQVIKHEIATTGDFDNVKSRNVVIGHSMGGFNAIYASFHEPSLIDTCIPIEPVIYGEPDGLNKFKKIFGKIGKIMVDKFEDLQEVEFFFKEFSFYKNFHPQVLQDFMEDEITTEIDPKTKKTKYKLKCKKEHQMSAYLGAFMSISIGMHILSLVRVPIFHIIGAKAVWNPPNSINWIRSTINPEFFGGGFDIPQGEHLVNGERPDEVIDIIAKILNQRAEKILSESRSCDLSREEIAKDQYQKLIDMKFEEVYGYFVETRDPQPKL